MTPITGITQITTGTGVCGNPFTLSSKGASCTLSLQVNGSQLTSPISDGPMVCQQGSTLQCYRPSSPDILNITTTTNEYTVGGTISGLTGTLSLLNNGSDALTTSTDGHFTFTAPITDGGSYAVTVQSDPIDQTCTVNNASGTINGANVANVNVTCSTNAYTVGGTVSGLSGTVVLRNNGTNATSISSDGRFTFSTPIAQGSTYAVTVLTQPSTQTCTVSNGTGTMGGANVTNVSVTCSTNTYSVGGTISGLSGTVILLNNGGDDKTVTSNDSFTFSTPVAQGSPYVVTVGTQPTTQTCAVSNGSGTMGGANVTNVGVTCVTNTTTLTVSATGTIPVRSGVGTLTVTNTGANSAFNVHASLPGAWTGVIQSPSNCATIAPSGTCTLTFTSTTPYVAQGGIPVTGDNITLPPTTALAFTVNNYLVWAVSGSTVQVIPTSDATGSPKVWSPTNNNISGITETSTAPPCNGATDGACNTVVIVAYYGPIPTANYAAGLCYGITSDNTGSVSAGTWYLPAICQMGGTGQGAGCVSGVANIDTNLVQLGFGSLDGYYWSSTEYSGIPTDFAWYQDFAAGGSNQLYDDKGYALGVRCSRALTL